MGGRKEGREGGREGGGEGQISKRSFETDKVEESGRLFSCSMFCHQQVTGSFHLLTSPNDPI